MTKFTRFDLRTTDADGARAFYAKILGHDRSAIWPLHEQALARGARPHWLGHLGVDDVESVAAAFVARGATQLGPTRPNSEGGESAVLRDPGGAIVSVSRLPTDAPIDVAWHVLNSNDAARAMTDYRDLFGWEMLPSVAHETEGTFHPFAWSAGGAAVGVIADLANRPGVHAHWLFVFDVDVLDAKIEDLRAAGGLALPPVTLPSGARMCVCDDPQGAAFALRERLARVG